MAEHVAVVRTLVDAGADVDLQDDQRNDALLVCGEHGNVAVLREVLRAEPDLRATNRFVGTALIPAGDRGQVASRSSACSSMPTPTPRSRIAMA